MLLTQLTPLAHAHWATSPHMIIYWTEQQWSEVWVSSPFNGPGHHSINKRPSWAFQSQTIALSFFWEYLSPLQGRDLEESSLGWVKTLQFPSFILKAKEHFLPFPVCTKSYLSAFLKEGTGYWVGAVGGNGAETGQSSWTKSPKYVLKNIFS